MNKLALSTIALVMTTAAGIADPAPVMTVSTGIGDVLAGDNGMTLYTFKKDEKGMSNCYDKCAVNWPPLMATPESNAHDPWSIVTRDDGSHQWAFKGKPLYRWIKDQKPGDRTGDGFKDVWHLARP